MSNNRFNKKIETEMPHKFSLCDVDGLVRWNNTEGTPTRIIFFEWKEANETLTDTQKETLIEIGKGFNWNKYDEHSGIYVIRAIEEYPDLDYVDVSSIMDCNNYTRMSFSSLYTWFNPNASESEINYIDNKRDPSTDAFIENYQNKHKE